MPTTDFDLATVDRLLTTTRAVRRRLDLERPVPRDVLLECLEIALQAPSGGNRQGWRWLFVTDTEKRRALAEIYRRGWKSYVDSGMATPPADDPVLQRVRRSSEYLAEHLHEVPVLVVPCVLGRLPEGAANSVAAGFYGSIFPAIWNFQLALRSRGLGSALTTLHLLHEADAAKLLGIPETVTQAALLPVAYTRGTKFRRAARKPATEVAYWDRWKRKLT